MNTAPVLRLLLVAALLPVVACSGDPSAADASRRTARTTLPPVGTSVGDLAPPFALLDPQGVEHTLAQYQGRVVLLDFWATWCGPCRQAMPGVQRLHEELGDDGLVVIGIDTMESRKDAAEAADAYMRQRGFTYELLLDGDSAVARAYGVTGIPRVFVIDQDGVIVLSQEGFSDMLEEQLHTAVERTLQGAG